MYSSKQQIDRQTATPILLPAYSTHTLPPSNSTHSFEGEHRPVPFAAHHVIAVEMERLSIRGSVPMYKARTPSSCVHVR